MPNKNNGLFKLSTVFIAMLPALLSGLNNKAQARDFFDPSFISSLNGSDPSTTPDLSVFQTQNAQAPGDYRVDIMFNGRYLDTRTIKFVANNHASSDSREPALVPCLSLKALEEYGVRIKAFPELTEDQNGCTNLSVIPDTKADFDFTAQRLNISIPQAALSTTAQGYIPPDQFDDGINALLVNYQFSGSNDMQENDEYYSLNLQSGLNVGPWRIRNLSTWNKNNSGAGDWDSAYLYMQRSIRPINSNLVMGESSSLSTIFDSVPFTGIQLATDTSMLPESMRGYAPIIRGIAKTNARVTIKQNGYQVYQTYVAPGAFEITDMYPSGGSGDLYVSVEESDGSKQEFVVPFATLPVMVRENQLEYEITSGKYRPYDGGVDETPFTQATATYGVSSSLTVYGGMQAASRYQALSTGLGYNLGELGAASADVTQAWSKMKDDEKTSGQSWRVRYGKNIVETGTNVTIAGYRYSTRGFNTLSEVLDSYSKDGNYSPRSLRNRTNLTVNQSLGKGLGSLSVSGLIEDYWDDKRTNKSISVGYNGGFRNVNYYLGYSYNRYTWSGDSSGKDAQDDQRITLTVTLPLSNWLPGTYTSYQLTNSNPGSTDQSVSIGGSGWITTASSGACSKGTATGNTTAAICAQPITVPAAALMLAIAMTITANVLTTAPTAAFLLMPMASRLARTSPTPPYWLKHQGWITSDWPTITPSPPTIAVTLSSRTLRLIVAPISHWTAPPLVKIWNCQKPRRALFRREAPSCVQVMTAISASGPLCI